MDDNNFDSFGDHTNADFDEAQGFPHANSNASTDPRATRARKKRLEDLLEHKRLSQELDDYDCYLSEKHNYYDDEIVEDYYQED